MIKHEMVIKQISKKHYHNEGERKQAKHTSIPLCILCCFFLLILEILHKQNKTLEMHSEAHTYRNILYPRN